MERPSHSRVHRHIRRTPRRRALRRLHLHARRRRPPLPARALQPPTQRPPTALVDTCRVASPLPPLLARLAGRGVCHSSRASRGGWRGGAAAAGRAAAGRGRGRGRGGRRGVRRRGALPPFAGLRGVGRLRGARWSRDGAEMEPSIEPQVQARYTSGVLACRRATTPASRLATHARLAACLAAPPPGSRARFMCRRVVALGAAPRRRRRRGGAARASRRGHGA